MSKFYVGQMVRIVATKNYPETHGMEAVVVGLFPNRNENKRIGIAIRGFKQHPENGYWSCPEWALEPITDSYDVVSWDTCAWKPERTPA